jgi:CheY-like chemotaxis protein
MSFDKGRAPDAQTERRPILLVDDDPDDVTLIEEALLGAGITVPLIRLENGEQAVDYLSGAPPYNDRTLFPLPRLVLLDLKMPKRNGFDVLAWIQAQPFLAELAVIVLTGSVREEDRKRAEELGAWDFQVKPVSFVELVRIVRHVEERWLGQYSHFGFGMRELNNRRAAGSTVQP